MKQVFISYTTHDLQRASAIRKMLEDHDISCWMGDKDIHASNTYTADITKAIEQCQVFVLVLSSYSQESSYVHSEFECAIAKNKPIIPFIIENFRIKEEFNFHILQRQAIAAFEDWKEAQHIILDTVQHLLSKSNSKRQHNNENSLINMDVHDAVNCEYPSRNDDRIIDVRYGKNRIPVKVTRDGKYQILCYFCEEDNITNRDPERANIKIDACFEYMQTIIKALMLAIIISFGSFVYTVDLTQESKLALLTVWNPCFWLSLFLILLLFVPKIKSRIREKNIIVNEPQYSAEECSQKLYCKKCKKTFVVKIPIDERKKFFFMDTESKNKHELGK